MVKPERPDEFVPLEEGGGGCLGNPDLCSKFLMPMTPQFSVDYIMAYAWHPRDPFF